MKIIIFFAVVIAFSLILNVIDKVRAYGKDNRSIWQDGDSVVVKDKDAENVGGGFGKRIG